MAFPGVVLLASHDHELLQTVCNRVIAFQPDGTIVDRIGTYDDYLAWMDSQKIRNEELNMNDRKPLELEECPDCRGTGALCHERGWCVYVECLDCGAHTAYGNTPTRKNRTRQSAAAALWNMGKVIHMRPGE